jgi:hypothetical protein
MPQLATLKSARRGNIMRKLSYLFALLALSLVYASRASANPIDPKVGLGGGGSCAAFSQTSLAFTLTVPTGCIVDFTNNIPGFTMTNLIVTINSAFTGVLSCVIDLNQPGNNGVSPFSFAQQTASNQCMFSGPPLGPPDAVLPGGTFGIQFGYPGFAFQSSTLSITVATPEPAVIALIGTGLVAIVGSRKRLAIKRPTPTS